MARHGKRLKGMWEALTVRGVDCGDCRKDASAELGLYRDLVYEAARIPRTGAPRCIGCMEKRLGRQVTARDLDPYVEINHPNYLAGGRVAKSRRWLERFSRL